MIWSSSQNRLRTRTLVSSAFGNNGEICWLCQQKRRGSPTTGKLGAPTGQLGSFGRARIYKTGKHVKTLCETEERKPDIQKSQDRKSGKVPVKKQSTIWSSKIQNCNNWHSLNRKQSVKHFRQCFNHK